MLDRPVVLYDGDCAFCRDSVEWVRRQDRYRRLDLVPYQERSDVDGLPAIPDDELAGAMHLIEPNGEIRRGAAAIAGIARYLPGMGWVRFGYAIPGMRFIAERAYAWVAARRHRFGCRDGRCRVKPPAARVRG